MFGVNLLLYVVLHIPSVRAPYKLYDTCALHGNCRSWCFSVSKSSANKS